MGRKGGEEWFLCLPVGSGAAQNRSDGFAAALRLAGRAPVRPGETAPVEASPEEVRCAVLRVCNWGRQR